MNEHRGAKFGHWVTASCDMTMKAKFEGLLDEIACLLVPQLLHNGVPQSSKQVQVSYSCIHHA